MDRSSRQRTINFNQRLNDGNGPAMAGRLNNEFYQRRPRIPTVQDLIERKRRRERRLLRRKVISAGWKANILNAIGLLATAALFLAHFTHLQADADYKLFYPEIVFPHIVNRDVIPNIIHNGHWLSGIAFLLHLIAIKVSKAGEFNWLSPFYFKFGKLIYIITVLDALQLFLASCINYLASPYISSF